MTAEFFAQLCEVGERARIATDTPGLALAYASGSGQTWFAGLGVADVATGTPIDAGTVFRWCSLTKLLVAETVIGLAAGDSSLLDTPVTRILTGLREPFTRVTVQMLLDHTSGIEGEWPVSLAEFGNGRDALERFVRAAGELRAFAPPGELFGYCNPGYWLLGAVIEKLTGTDVEDALCVSIVQPTSLTTLFTEGQRREREGEPAQFWAGGKCANVATPYICAAAGPHPNGWDRMPRARVASGGAWGSVGDAIRFGLAMLERPESAWHLRAGRAVQTGEPGGYQGLGWRMQRRARGTSFGHSGSYDGYVTQLQIFPRSEACGEGGVLAIFANSDSGAGVRSAVLNFALERLHGEVVHPQVQPAPAPSDFAGSYGFPEIGSIELEFSSGVAAGGELTVRASGELGRGFRVAAAEGHGRLYRVAEGPFAGQSLELLPLGDGPGRAIRLGGRLGGRLEARAGGHAEAGFAAQLGEDHG